MSAIGNYVHLYKENYMKYGLTRKDTNSTSATSALSEMKNILQLRHTNRFLAYKAKEIEDAYNQILYNEDKDNNIKETMLRVLTKKIEEDFDKRLVVTDNYNVEKKDLQSVFNLTANNLNQLIQLGSDEKDKDTQKWIKELEEIEKFINNYTEYVANLNKIEAFQQKIQNIKNEISQKGNIPIKDIKYSINDIQKMINEYNQTNIEITNPKGSVGETAVALVGYILDLKAHNVTDENIKKVLENQSSSSQWTNKIKGGKTDKLQYTLSGFKDISEQTYNKIITDNKGEEKAKIAVTSKRSKTDVVFTFYLNNNIYLATKVKMSVKNSAGQNLKLADSTPLYDVLKASNNMNFVNHYLNIITENKEKEKYKINSKDREEANLLVRVLTTRVALKGYSPTKSANYLGVNDIINKKFHVYSIPVLISILEQNYEQHKYNNMMSGLPLSYQIEQKREDTVRTRISNILSSLHKKKIIVQGKKEVWFNAYDNFLKNNKIT